MEIIILKGSNGSLRLGREYIRNEGREGWREGEKKRKVRGKEQGNTSFS